MCFCNNIRSSQKMVCISDSIHNISDWNLTFYSFDLHARERKNTYNDDNRTNTDIPTPELYLLKQITIINDDFLGRNTKLTTTLTEIHWNTRDSTLGMTLHLHGKLRFTRFTYTSLFCSIFLNRETNSIFPRDSRAHMGRTRCCLKWKKKFAFPFCTYKYH